MTSPELLAGSPWSLASAAAGLLIAVGFFWAAWVSGEEGELRAARRFVALAPIFVGPFFLGLLVPGPVGEWIALGVLAGALLLLGVFLAPFSGGDGVSFGDPKARVDERDIMFSRAALVPGTERYRQYYGGRPENKGPDDAFRKEPGLLDPASIHYHPLGFPAADAAFWTIERLRPWAEDGSAQGSGKAGAAGNRGEPPDPEGGMKLDGEAGAKEPLSSFPGTPAEITRFLKAWLKKQGAHSVGVAELEPYHLYTHVGRGPDYGRPVELNHPYAVALTVEMDREMVDRAPLSPTLMESALQYLNSGVMAVQTAELIRHLGFRARAHVDGNYRVICPLVARDAGLGELGRMGLLMTPRLGPRVRIAVVTTDLPLVTDSRDPDPTTIDFCSRCLKCAEVCPSAAISLGPPEEDEEGVRRWRIDAEACFTLWTRMGTDCARCMSVCPYAHADNTLHGMVRRGIRRNALFRRAAVHMDDLIYGRRPPPRALPDWMVLSGSERGADRMDGG